MRIAVIGGGGAGLGCAWLLEDAGHDVVVFEREAQPGGHVQTVDAAADGVSPRPVDLGVRFFSRAGWPRLVALLEILDVPVVEYGQTLTFYDRDAGWTVPLPPYGSWRRWASLRQRRTRRILAEFRRVLARGARLLERVDWAPTLGEVFDDWRVPEQARAEFLYPYFSSNWGIPCGAVRELSARAALFYTCTNRPTGLGSSRWLRVPGGLGRYVEALCGSLRSATIRRGARVRELRRSGGAAYEVLADGVRDERPFEQVVLAVGAEDALRLLSPLDEGAELRDVLRRFDYFDTRVALHRDRSKQPPRREEWSTVQLVREGDGCSIHEWIGHDRGDDLFRSWIPDGAVPTSALHVGEFRHARPTPEHFAAQRALRSLQGRDGLWCAGCWSAGVDSHDSALDSALRVAERLAPRGARRQRLSAATREPV